MSTTLNYASLTASPVRLRPLALAAVLLAFSALPRLCSLFLSFDSYRLPSRAEILVRSALWLAGTAAVVPAVWLLGRVFPRPSNAFPWKFSAVFALAILNLLSVVLNHGTNLFNFLWQLWELLPESLHFFIFYFYLSDAIPCLLNLFAIAFILNLARRARILWLALAVPPILTLAVLVNLLNLIQTIAFTGFSISSPPFNLYHRLTAFFPWLPLRITEAVAQLALWLSLALFATLLARKQSRPPASTPL